MSHEEEGASPSSGDSNRGTSLEAQELAGVAGVVISVRVENRCCVNQK